MGIPSIGVQLITAESFASVVAQWREPLEAYARLLVEKNQVLNLISRRQEDQVLSWHIFHCVAAGVFLPFADGEEILDVGTGGGLPGIPLAIMFPKCRFTLLDSIGKKIYAVAEFVEKLGLRNVSTFQSRVESLPPRKNFDVITGRSVAALPQFLKWTWPRLRKPSNLPAKDQETDLPPQGVIYIGGGALTSNWRMLGLPQPRIFSLASHCHISNGEGKWVAYFQKT
ncbi:MAG: 16S rRNA (guanine(527)-N(7))-methyltransferase RsmG [Puniceicoccales bacterium]|jgi:16S rRNA (guanine527-N7)-methyltransferase|nr:16S rRNA (guanine(527)-N(7))-methyltransferase RsmG [Puniceicoccales bacterium]